MNDEEAMRVEELKREMQRMQAQAAEDHAKYIAEIKRLNQYIAEIKQLEALVPFWKKND